MNHIQNRMIVTALYEANIYVDTLHDWVSIENMLDKDDSVFLQGDDASSFIHQANAFYNTDGTVSMKEAYAFVAYPYLELLGV